MPELPSAAAPESTAELVRRTLNIVTAGIGILEDGGMPSTEAVMLFSALMELARPLRAIELTEEALASAYAQGRREGFRDGRRQGRADVLAGQAAQARTRLHLVRQLALGLPGQRPDDLAGREAREMTVRPRPVRPRPHVHDTRGRQFQPGPVQPPGQICRLMTP